MDRIFAKLLYEQEKERDTVLVSIVDDQGSAPRGIGSQMLVGGAGRILGTIGGGAVEKRSEEIALEVLVNKVHRLEAFALNKAKENNLGMVCGGDVKVLFQYISGSDDRWRKLAGCVIGQIEKRVPGWLVLYLDGRIPSVLDEHGQVLVGSSVCGTVTHKMWLPDSAEDHVCLPLPIGERVFLFGAGHCAYALAPLLVSVGFRVTVFDDRVEYANKDRFPSAERIIVGDFTRLSEYIEVTPLDYAVVMTSGHSFDLEVQDQILREPMAYIGVIGSKSKKAAVNQKLLERGVSQETIDRVHSPIGTPIKAVTPEEIAVSIAGEMIYTRALIREGQGTVVKGCPMK